LGWRRLVFTETQKDAWEKETNLPSPDAARRKVNRVMDWKRGSYKYGISCGRRQGSYDPGIGALRPDVGNIVSVATLIPVCFRAKLE